MARIVIRNRTGQPGVPMRQSSWPRRAFRFPVLRRRSIRTLIKAKGPGTPGGFGAITDAKGVDAGGGFSASPRVLRAGKRDPQPTGGGRKVIKAPGVVGGIKNRRQGT